MRTPDFIILGSQKAGTTSLYKVLREHPELCLPDNKELNYFFDPSLRSQGLGWYGPHFKHAQPGQLCGEASPGYFCHPEVPYWIKRQRPDAKLIVTVREPISRAWSQYWHNRRLLAEPEAFDDIVGAPLHDVFVAGQRNYFSRGAYSVYLARYLALFPKEQILVLPFEQIKTDPEAFYKRCFEFLGVDASFEHSSMAKASNPRVLRSNPFFRLLFARPGLSRLIPRSLRRLFLWGARRPFDPKPMSAHSRKTLEAYYAPYNRRLEEMTGLELGWSPVHEEER